tara:strand:- start:3867 stop:4394 length:528 start_codon:yes stop_codon:yes gene_type:complete
MIDTETLETLETWKSAGGKVLTLWAVGDAPEGPDFDGDDARDPTYKVRTSGDLDGGWPSNTRWHHTKSEAATAARQRSQKWPAVFWPVKLLYFGGAAQAAAVGYDFMRYHISAASTTELTKKWEDWARKDRGRLGRLVKKTPELAPLMAQMMLGSFLNADVFAPDPECCGRPDVG